MYLCYNCYTIKEVNMKEIKAKYLLVDNDNTTTERKGGFGSTGI